MSMEAQANGSSWQCWQCKVWVPFGHSHNCIYGAKSSQQVSFGPSADERIAIALERIADSLGLIAAATPKPSQEGGE